MKTVMAGCAIILFFAGTAAASMPGYPPFPKNKTYPPHPRAVNLLEKSGPYILKNGDEELTLRAARDEIGFTLLKSNGTEIYNYPGDYDWLYFAYWLDVTGDKRKDLILVANEHGNGLGALRAKILILTQCLDGQFIMHTSHTFDCAVSETSPSAIPVMKDFVDLNNDGSFELLQADFCGGWIGKITRNYFVYDVYEFSNGKYVLANEKYSDHFPKYIWYTEKDNDKPARKVPAEIKKQHEETTPKELSVLSACP